MPPSQGVRLRHRLSTMQRMSARPTPPRESFVAVPEAPRQSATAGRGLVLQSCTFEGADLGVHGARDADGQHLSVAFDSLAARSTPSPNSEGTQVATAEGWLRCCGRGWVKVRVLGRAESVGCQSQAHLLARVEGQELIAVERPQARAGPEAWLQQPSSRAPTDALRVMDMSLAVRVVGAQPLRISLLLLARCDGAVAEASAACRVSRIDLSVMESRPAQRARPTRAQGAGKSNWPNSASHSDTHHAHP
jgi:hypothetical protein